MPDARLDEAMLAAMRAKAGLTLRIEHSVNNEEATRLAIAKFVDGIGDLNPLWSDEAHSTSSAYGRSVAPPSWVVCVFAGLQFGWPGLGSFHSASDLTFHRPVFRGDRIEPTCVYEGFDGPRPSRFADQIVVDRFRNTYRNQHGVLVAEIHWSVVNFERAKARDRQRSDVNVEPHCWDEAELAEVEAEVLAEEARGATRRHWEDVNVGDSLDGLTKGPIGMTDEIAYVVAGGAPIPRLAAHATSLSRYREHPAWAFRDPETGALEPIYAVHYHRGAARAMGVPLQYDVGFQRQCWQIHVLTNWIGDEGWVKRASAQYRRFVFHGDVVRLGGTVTEKLVDADGEHCVRVSTSATNQRGEEVMPGTAVLALPTRAGPTPVQRRVDDAGGASATPEFTQR